MLQDVEDLPFTAKEKVVPMSQFLKFHAAWRLMAIVLSVLSLVSIGIAQVHTSTCALGDECCSDGISAESTALDNEAECDSDSDHDAPPHSGCADNCAAGCCAGPLVFAVTPALSVTFEFTRMAASPTEALGSARSEGSEVSVFRPPRLFT